METNIRQADAKVNVTGVVSEVDLKLDKDDKGVEQITGTVTVKTSEFNFIPFKVWTRAKKNDGTDNKQFAGIKTVMEEYKPLARYSEEEADKISVSGNVNPFEGRNGVSIGYRSNFFNRLRGGADAVFEPKAEFDIEMYIKAIVPEMVKNSEDVEESGRYIMKGWMPTYNGIEPIEAIIPEDLVDDIQDLYSPGDTVNIWGDIINSRVVKDNSKTGAFGKAKKKVETTFINELVITGGEPPYDEDNPLHYTKEVIDAAVQERENKKEADKANAANARSNTRPSGAARGRKLEGFLDI